LAERGKGGDRFRGRPRAQEANDRHPLLLCARHGRPRDRRATDKRDEITSSHCLLQSSGPTPQHNYSRDLRSSEWGSAIGFCVAKIPRQPDGGLVVDAADPIEVIEG
jgi:hypothetical protein